VSPAAPGARKRVLLIVNPYASRAPRVRAAAERAFDAARVDLDVKITEKVGDSGRLAREWGLSGHYRHVFVCGGDGTVVEAIAALADNPTAPAVGVLAGGTGNLLARALRIPLNPARAIRALMNGRQATIDLGRLENGSHFAIGLGVGLDEAMIAGATSALKKRYGVFAYVYSALKAGIKLEKFDARVTVDGKVTNCRSSAILVANLGTVVGGLITFGKGIAHDDGLLHACIYSPGNFLDATRIFTRMLRGTAHLDPQVTVIGGRDILLETTPARGVQADGELLGPTPIRITVRPNAGRILIP
jgi:diacylglycerol kinase (ATP)